MLQEACECVFQPVETLAERVIQRDAEIDREEVAVEGEVIRLMALYQPVGADLRLLFTILKVTNDLERIADCTVNLAERARHKEVQELARRSEFMHELCPLVRRSLRNVVHAYANEAEDVARRVIEDDQNVDDLFGRVVKEVVAMAPNEPDRIAGHLDLLSIAKNLERIADHATNIAEDVIFLLTGAIVRHQ